MKITARAVLAKKPNPVLKIISAPRKSLKTEPYAYAGFTKEFSRALNRVQAGQMLNWRQVMSVLQAMGYIDEEPSDMEAELARTLTFMLASPSTVKAVSRVSLLRFLLVLSNIRQP